MSQRYEFLEKIGAGGQGEVFLVRDTLRQNRLLALKRLHDGATAFPELATEFETLSRLRHPNLARAYDFGNDTEGPFFTSEFVAGPDLSTWAKDATEDAVLRAAGALLRALALIHDRDLVHGDVSPSNVIVGQDEELGYCPKLLDLGGALRPGQSGAATTPGYAAPEVLSGRGALPASDLYSFGVILAFALFHKHPFGNGDASETVKRQFNDQVDLPDHNVVPLAGLCLDLLRSDPASRPQSARAVLGRLGNLTDTDIAVRFCELSGGDLPAPKTVGRNLELASLKGLIDQVDDPAGQRVALITGSEGSGRSTLLAEIIRHAQLSGIGVIGHEAAAPEIDLLLSDLLMRAEGAILPNASRKILAPWAGKHGFGVDKAKKSPVDSVTGAVSPASATPAAVGYAAVDTLAAATAQSTILVVIDDMNRGGEIVRSVSLTLARSLSGERRHRPNALFIATGAEGDFSDQWQELAPLNIHLEPLNKRDIDAMVSSMLPGVSLPPELEDSAFHASKGIPGLAVQFVRQAAGPEGDLDGDKYAESMVASLEPRVRELLAAISLLEGSCSFGIAQQLGVLPEEADRLLKAGYFVETTSSSEPGIRVPAAIARAAHHQTDLDRIGEQAENLATLLEKNERLGEVARLFEKSGSLTKAIMAWSKLAERYLAQGNVSSASDCYEQAQTIDRDGQHFGPLAAVAVDTWRAVGRYDLALGGLEAADFPEHTKQHLKAELILSQGKHAEALAIAENIKIDNESPLSALGIIAACQLQLGKHEAALATVKEAFGERDESQRDEHTARLAQIGGLACAYLGRFDEADSFFSLAKSSFEVIENSTGQIKVLANRGFVERRRGDLPKAHSLYNRAIALAKKSGDRPREGLNLMNRATISLVTGDIGSAHEDYLAALDIAVVSGNGFARSQVEVNLADLLSGLGNQREALRLAGQAIERCRALGHGRLETRAQLVSGVALLWAGASHRAERRLKEARRRFAATGDDAQIVSTDLHLAEYYLRRGYHQQASVFAEQIAKATEQKGSRRDRARVLVIQARVNAESGADLDQALGLLNEAASILRQDSLPDELWRLLVHRARILKQAGRPQDAHETLAEAGEVFEQILRKVPEPYRKSYSELAEAADLPLGDSVVGSDEAQRGRHARNLERLMEINRELTREHDPKRLLSLIMEYAVELTGAERGMVVMPKTGGLEPVISYQISDEFDVSFSRSVAEQVVAEGRAILAIDAMGDDRFRAFASVHTMKLRSILAVPLCIRRRVVGVVYLDSRLRAGIFSDSDRRLLEAFGAQAAISLETARLISENAKRCEDLQQANSEIRKLSVQLEERLEQNEAKLRRVGALLQKTQKDESERLKENGIIGRAPAMQQVMRVVDRIAMTDVPVYVFGGSGTGKELVARALHAASERSEHPFVPVNCGALPPKLLASELFGHMRGAFTGAVSNRPGLFRLAHQGTLFLDEVVDMDPEMQAHLLRVLQDGKFRSLGGSDELSVDVRILSASNRDLEEEVRVGNFREDLFYRLNVVRIDVPALADRREDIPLLADFFARRHGGEGTPKFARETMDILIGANWPGNVRELENEVLRAITMAEPGGPIVPDDLSPRFRRKLQGEVFGETGSLKKRVDVFERMLIQRVLSECEGNATKAAKQLKISRAGLYKKIEKHHIER